jgi:hypothetical protein
MYLRLLKSKGVSRVLDDLAASKAKAPTLDFGSAYVEEVL